VGERRRRLLRGEGPSFFVSKTFIPPLHSTSLRQASPSSFGHERVTLLTLALALIGVHVVAVARGRILGVGLRGLSGAVAFFG